MTKDKIQTSFFIGLLIAAIALVFLIFLPYLNILALAILLAIVFEPLYRKILSIAFQKEWLAALLTIIIAIFIVLIPLTLIGASIWREATQLYGELASNNQGANIAGVIGSSIEKKLAAINSNLLPNVNYLIKQTADWIISQTGAIFSSVAQFLFNLFLTILALFYLLKDSDKVLRSVTRLSPFNGANNAAIIDKFKKYVNSVIVGALAIAIIQGLLLGAGFYSFGVPRGALWGSVSAIASLIPFVGAMIIFAPAAAYLFIIGKTASGIGLLIWGISATTLANSFLAPKLMKRGANIHPLLVLFSVLGGLAFFGPIGLLFGPIMLGLLFALLEIYQKDFIQ